MSLIWVGEDMSWGELKMLRYGGVLVFNGWVISFFGDCVVMEVSFERKGLLGLIGGIGILVVVLMWKVFEFFFLDEFKERGGEECGSREFIDVCK